MSEVGMELIHPATGELLPLAAPTDTLAAAIDDLKDFRQHVSSVIDALGDELTARLDSENTRTGRVGGWEIVTKAPFVTEYDPERLRNALLELVPPLTERVVQNTVKEPPVKDWKVDKREVAKLLNHADERVVEAVKACAVKNPQKRSVNVKRMAA